MSSTRNPGRVAGFWYLLLCVIGPLRLMYIPSKVFVPGNATATVNNIAAHQWLLRFGIVGDLLCAVILILLVLAFYRLFKGVPCLTKTWKRMATDPSPDLNVWVINPVYCSEATVARTFCRTDGGSGT